MNSVAEMSLGMTGADIARRLGPDLSGGIVLRRRPNSAVVRLPVREVGTVIVKLWTRPGWRGCLRRFTGTEVVQREWRLLLRLHGAGVAVPRPYGVARVSFRDPPYTDALILEDLGETRIATESIKQFIADGHGEQLHAFEQDVIELTRAMVGAGVIDTDHSVMNIVVPASGRPMRLDLEVARLILWPNLAAGSYGRMIGRLVGTYAFAVQPDMDRARQFAVRLAESLRPRAAVLRVARRCVQHLMDEQRRTVGIDMRVDLPW